MHADKRCIVIMEGDHGFAFRLEKHDGENIVEVFETDSFEDVMMEANSWVRFNTQCPPRYLPTVIPSRQPDEIWEDWMAHDDEWVEV